MQNPNTLLDGAGDLIAQSDSLTRYDAIIHRLDRLLTLPHVTMLLSGLFRLRKLQQVLSWPMPVIEELTEEGLDQLIQSVMEVPGMRVALMESSRLKQDYPVWASLVNHDPAPDAHTCLYGLLVLVSGAGKRISLLRTLASAIRGAGHQRRSGDETLLDILEDVPYASEPEQFFELLLDQRHRIAQAKPALHELLITDIPALLGWHVPQYQQEYEDLDWTPPTPVPLPPDTPLEPWEPEEEVQAPDEYLPAVVDITRPIGSLRSALTSLHQRIHGGNPLMVPEHISSLRTEEARYLTEWLHKNITQADSNADPRMVTGAAILATMLATGRTAPRAAAILETALSHTTKEDRPTLDLKSGQLVQPVLIPKSAYRADDDSLPHLLETSQTMRLPLPPRYIEMVERWKSFASEVRPLAHWKSIYPALGKIRQDTELDYTEGRIRHTLSCHACEVSGDPLQSIWITCNDARHSLAPAHYCVLGHAELENTYAKAIWPIFQAGENIPRYSGKTLVGAQTCPTDDFIQNGLKRLTARVHSPTRGQKTKESLVEIHNGLADHITMLLVVLTGHRPNTAIYELNRWDFNLDLGVAIYQDKRFDPAHFFCPVALGKILTSQLVVYEHHLAILGKELRERAAPLRAIERVDQAISGEAPWFFHLDDELQPKIPSYKEWRALFSACFPGVPPNVGRSYLARKLRTIDNSRAEFAYLLLGHYAIIGYPYIADGPTSIAELSRTLGPLMDEIVKDALGRMRKVNGLYRGSRAPKPMSVSSPYIGIRDWGLERRETEEAVQAHKQKLRSQRKLAAKKLRPEAEARFFRRMSRIHSKFAQAIRSHFQDNRLPELAMKYQLKPEDIDLLLDESPQAPADSRKSLPAADVIALQNFTHYALSRARKSRYYSGPLPRAEIRLPSRFRTEFIPNMLAAQETMARLRQTFYRTAFRDLPASAAEHGITIKEWHCAYLAAVLILYGGVTHLSRLTGLLTSRCQVAPHPKADAAVLIEYSTEPHHVWALWQSAAVVYLQMRESMSDTAPDPLRISKALQHLLPQNFLRHERADLLSCLLDTARVAQLTSLSGMARASLDPDTGSWSMPLLRQVAWLANSDDPSEPPETLPSQSGKARPGRMPRSREVRKIYDSILPLLPRANKDVVDEEGNVKIPHETHRRYRQQVIDSLRQVIDRPQAPDLGRALGDWVCQMLYQKKAEGVYAFAESTIYNYFTTVGSGFLTVLPERVTMDLDDDEYIDLYAALLESKPEKSRKTTGRELRNFHFLLMRKYGAPELQWSELADYLVDVPGRVDAQAVLSREAEHALHTLKYWAFSQAENKQADRRLVRQSYMVLLLLILTGCRLSEITAMQHRDVYQLYGKLYVRIRPNYGRGTKTVAAKRILDVTDAITDEEQRFIVGWKEAEQRRLGKKWKMTSRLFLNIDTNRPVDRDLLRAYTQSALRQSTQWPLISHHIRHGLGGRMQIDFGLCHLSVGEGTRMDSPLDYLIQENRPLLLPRQTRRYQIIIGHATSSTTNRSYGHLPWVYLHFSALDWNSDLDSASLAAATNRTPVALRKSISRYKKNHWTETLDQYLSPAIPDPPSKERDTRDPPSISTSGLPAAARYLMACAPGVTNSQKGALEQDYEAYGLDSETLSSLIHAGEDVARSTGIAFFPRHAELGRVRSSMVPQTSLYSANVMGLLDSLESNLITVDSITIAYVAASNPNKRDVVLLPGRQARELRDLVAQYCKDLKLDLTQQKKGYLCHLVGPDDAHLNHWLAWILAMIAILLRIKLD